MGSQSDWTTWAVNDENRSASLILVVILYTPPTGNGPVFHGVRPVTGKRIGQAIWFKHRGHPLFDSPVVLNDSTQYRKQIRCGCCTRKPLTARALFNTGDGRAVQAGHVSTTVFDNSDAACCEVLA